MQNTVVFYAVSITLAVIVGTVLGVLLSYALW